MNARLESLAGAALIMCCLPTFAQESASRTRCSQPALRDELVRMLETDQRSRQHVIERPDDRKALFLLLEQDRERTQRVLAILKEHGWPTTAQVGADGSEAIWTILQHSDPAVLQSTLALMEKAATRHDLDWGLVATSIDRIRVNEGKKQLYGTQLEKKGGKLVPYPIQEEAKLDERRKRMGLGPFEEYLKRLEQR
ncbi:MAG: hypothetical protein LAO05_15785 [Acidobacteriia bacterium]|nr:hypothetical protein [Terriglobia bacterium]